MQPKDTYWDKGKETPEVIDDNEAAWSKFIW